MDSLAECMIAQKVKGFRLVGVGCVAMFSFGGCAVVDGNIILDRRP